MKRLVIYISCALACCMLFLYSSSAVEYAVRGFFVWRDSIMPALLPFFVCAYIMQNIGVPSSMERCSLIALCFISGAPSGARLMSAYDMPDTRTVAILNTVSPMFIYASFCSGMLNSPGLAWPIIIAQLIASSAMLLIFPPRYSSPVSRLKEPEGMGILASGIASGVGAVLNICGSMIFFMALFGAFEEVLSVGSSFGGAMCTGLLEMVSGCMALSRLSLSPPVMAAAAAFLFSFGGICIFAQSLMFCSLSFTKYFSVKLIQGAIAGISAYLLTPLFPCVHAVFTEISLEQLVQNTGTLFITGGVSLLSMAAVMIIGAAARYRKLTGKGR